MNSQPISISVIVPCYNEARSIGLLLEALRTQSYPLTRMEIIVADGGSDDGTRDHIQGFAKSHPEMSIRVVDNPSRVIPAALNRAIEQSAGEFVVRLDAHSAPYPDYIERCLETLRRTNAANVGGVWEIRPGRDTWVGHAIAAAAAHPLGAGDARYRISGEEGPVETVPFGAYPRAWLKKVGRFNPELLTNEDYEYNVRIRSSGGLVWFNPAIRSTYLARGTLRELARQYLRYGFWKARMLLRHPTTIRWRQALPPLFVFGTAVLLIGSIWIGWARTALAIELGAYVAVLLGAGVIEVRRRRVFLHAVGLLLALPIMQLAWGCGFWSGLMTGVGKMRGDHKS